MGCYLKLQEKSDVETADKSDTGPAADHNRQTVTGGVRFNAREVLNSVLGILDQGLKDIADARDSVIDTTKNGTADVSWLKVQFSFLCFLVQ